MSEVIVVGGGASGLIAAGQAAARGAITLLLEKMEQPGRKLLLTGKGRCNLTNLGNVQQFIEHFNPQGQFLTQLFYRFFHPHLRDFFEELGVPTEVQRGDRVFPKSEDARDVRDALLRWIGELGVEVITNTPVIHLIIEDEEIKGVETHRGNYHAQAVIIATGGAAYPGTGSTGDGFQLAREAGHTIVPIRPALVPLVTQGDTAPKLQGLSLRNVQANLWVDGKKTDDPFGEMLFTHFGLSGPIILTLSRQVVDHLRSGRNVVIAIDLKPALDHPTLDDRLLRDIQALGRKQFSSLLEGLLPKKLIPICTEQTGIPWDKKNNQISAEERTRLRMWLKEDFRFQIVDHLSFDQAIVTAGGVDTREVNPQTMESKRIRGLYFAGEVLDVDADTGGYNLQAAFSTGWAAGRAAASRVKG
ncbi:MAG: NAD(P)/FAD-dependent oxidoreductase [Anaerolineales bacterium]